MKSICADNHMPDVLTVWRWRHEREDFCKLIQRAREAQSEAMIDACQELADEAAPSTRNAAPLQSPPKSWPLKRG